MKNQTFTFRCEQLESRQMLASDLVISELLAANDNDIRDEDYTRPDWIEILNTGRAEASLDGWYLTDDAGDLNKWRFPDVLLGPGQRMVVFASGKDRVDPRLPLHTSFRLTAAGGYLALVEPDGSTVAFDYGAQYPPQVPDVSFGMPQAVSTVPLIPLGHPVRTLIPTEENGGSRLEQSWTAIDFDDSLWQQGALGVGYERSSGYEDLIGADVEGQMYEVNKTAYLRIPFTVGDPASVFSLTLSVQYDDGYVAFLNGVEVAGANAPDPLSWDSGAPGRRRDSQSLVFEDVDLSRFVSLLRPGDNVLAIQGLNDNARSNDFLIVPKLTAEAATEVLVDDRQYFVHPSAGTPNGLGTTTAIVDVAHSPTLLRDGDTLTVTAALQSMTGEVNAMTLYYRAMFDQEQSMPMADDGHHGDGAAGDGVFGATIPAGLASPGQMIRYRITAGQTPANAARSPVFKDPEQWQEYYGTIVENPAVVSNLPVMHLFVEDTDATTTRQGTQGALWYDGEFYDNIHIDVHGFTTRGFPKKSHDIFFPRDHRFRLADDLPRMKDINILTNYGDPTKVRNTLSYGTYRRSGTPAHLAFPLRVEQNGQFLGVYDFVEDGDDEFLEREGLNPRGALYKMDNILDSATISVEKKTRTEEDNSDLQALVDGVQLTGEARKAFLYDHVNVPAMVNYLVGLVLTGESDCCHRNYYVYRDSEGTGQWQYMPWDVDKSFGRQGTFDEQVHIEPGNVFKGRGNRLIDALLETPEIKAMYLRRLRTLLDELLQPADTPQHELKYERWVDELAEQLAPDIPRELEAWGSLGGDRSWEENLEIFKSQYFPARRQLVYRSLTQANGGKVIEPQAAAPPIQVGAIVFNPASGNQDQEYIELRNPLDVAVDLSGWQLDGGAQFTFRPGTVIPPRGTLYVSPDLNAFRERTAGPTGGHGLFVVGGYSGHLSNFGETIELKTADGSVVASVTTPSDPSPAQQYLRIAEVMYHPPEPEPDSPYQDEDFEFIELVNISDTETLGLENVAFTDGVQFTFPVRSLPPGERVLVVSNQQAFQQRYGTDLPVAGQYVGRLDNGGEPVRLDDRTGSTILDFVYDDSQPWPGGADGSGSSLQVIDPAATLRDQLSDPEQWRAADPTPGAPGPSAPLVGDSNLDGMFDSQDLQHVLAAGKYLAGVPAAFAEGDWNGDGVFDQADIVVALQASAFRPAER